MDWQQCDQCVARALVFFDLGRGRELAYCSHHANINTAALSLNAAVIVDMRHLDQVKT